MLIIKGEARCLISEDRSYKDKKWIDHSLNIELEDGLNARVYLGQDIATAENINKLKTLKGKRVELNIRIYHKGDFLKYYLVDMPSFN